MCAWNDLDGEFGVEGLSETIAGYPEAVNAYRPAKRVFSVAPATFSERWPHSDYGIRSTRQKLNIDLKVAEGPLAVRQSSFVGSQRSGRHLVIVGARPSRSRRSRNQQVAKRAALQTSQADSAGSSLLAGVWGDIRGIRRSHRSRPRFYRRSQCETNLNRGGL